MKLVVVWLVIERWDGCPQENIPPSDKEVLHIALTKAKAEAWWQQYVEPSWKRDHCWIESGEAFLMRDGMIALVDTMKLGTQGPGKAFENDAQRRVEWESEQKKRKRKKRVRK